MVSLYLVPALTPEQRRRSAPGYVLTIYDIIMLVAIEHDYMPLEKLLGRDRTRPVAMARQMAMYLAHAHTGESLTEIGRVLGRTHATVKHGIQQCKNDSETCTEYANRLNRVTQKLGVK